jgi:hypothetical protein
LRRDFWVSAISQNQPGIIEIKGLKTSHLREVKQLHWTGEKYVQWGMSNVLKVSLQTTIHSLAECGWSQRRIASELGINRETVRRYLRLACYVKCGLMCGSYWSNSPKGIRYALRILLDHPQHFHDLFVD